MNKRIDCGTGTEKASGYDDKRMMPYPEVVVDWPKADLEEEKDGHAE